MLCHASNGMVMIVSCMLGMSNCSESLVVDYLRRQQTYQVLVHLDLKIPSGEHGILLGKVLQTTPSSECIAWIQAYAYPLVLAHRRGN